MMGKETGIYIDWRTSLHKLSHSERPVFPSFNREGLSGLTSIAVFHEGCSMAYSYPPCALQWMQAYSTEEFSP